MSDKLIITESQVCKGRIAAYIKNDRLCEVHGIEETENSCVQNIYVGKVASISKNLNAAFIEIKKGLNCYYPLEELSTAVFTKKAGKKLLVVGDELLVQVTKEAVKTKAPVVSTKLSVAGRYCVASSGFSGIRFSAKLSEDEKQTLAEALDTVCQGRSAGLLVRTNGRFASPEEIAAEYRTLSDMLTSMIASAHHRTCFSLLYSPADAPISGLKNDPGQTLQEIVTDDPGEYERLCAVTELPVRLYSDTGYPLSKLYNLDQQITDGLQPRVWLKSGAYLVIQPTEALVAIDVNTGKCVTGKDREETFFKINMEAAEEIARQLRLRRLSGVIIIDFINMKDKSSEYALEKRLRTLFLEDRAHPAVVGMTRLGLMEVTRRKTEKSLYEFLKKYGIL